MVAIFASKKIRHVNFILAIIAVISTFFCITLLVPVVINANNECKKASAFFFALAIFFGAMVQTSTFCVKYLPKKTNKIPVVIMVLLAFILCIVAGFGTMGLEFDSSTNSSMWYSYGNLIIYICLSAGITLFASLTLHEMHAVNNKSNSKLIYICIVLVIVQIPCLLMYAIFDLANVFKQNEYSHIASLCRVILPLIWLFGCMFVIENHENNKNHAKVTKLSFFSIFVAIFVLSVTLTFIPESPKILCKLMYALYILAVIGLLLGFCVLFHSFSRTLLTADATEIDANTQSMIAKQKSRDLKKERKVEKKLAKLAKKEAKLKAKELAKKEAQKNKQQQLQNQQPIQVSVVPTEQTPQSITVAPIVQEDSIIQNSSVNLNDQINQLKKTNEKDGTKVVIGTTDQGKKTYKAESLPYSRQKKIQKK
ncbi:MAG: hypothetical protein Ta2E_03630 [Mycoplasmoidaceae bacterium]|nr:MAG: hypothetical protein Ta2E_03630 [Mycoplasmoidaceae bacterium]